MQWTRFQEKKIETIKKVYFNIRTSANFCFEYATIIDQEINLKTGCIPMHQVRREMICLAKRHNCLQLVSYVLTDKFVYLLLWSIILRRILVHLIEVR